MSKKRLDFVDLFHFFKFNIYKKINLVFGSNINFYFIGLFVFSLLIFSGCNTGGYSFQSQSSKVDTTGNGLELNLDLDDEWISQGLIGYSLSISNSGLKEISLNQDNFNLYTVQVLGDGKPVLLGFDKFFQNLFSKGNLVLYHDQSLDSIIKGQFRIEPNYFNDLNHNKINLGLKVNYDYETEFNNNVKLDMKNKKLIFADKVSQAAPVEVNKIILKPTPYENQYEIGFYIHNKNKFGFDEVNVKFNSVDFKFGTNELNDCSLFGEQNGNYILISKNLDYDKMILNDLNDNLLITCKLDLSDFDDTEVRETMISGDLKYNYEFLISKKIFLPKKRNMNPEW